MLHLHGLLASTLAFKSSAYITIATKKNLNAVNAEHDRNTNQKQPFADVLQNRGTRRTPPQKIPPFKVSQSEFSREIFLLRELPRGKLARI